VVVHRASALLRRNVAALTTNRNCADWRGHGTQTVFQTARLGVHIGVRDLRIDFFRGLALYMVVVDHIGGDPLGKFTYQAVGFSDAAEIFIFFRRGLRPCILFFA